MTAIEDMLGWLFEAARFETMAKALVLLLLMGGVIALWELIRYMRSIRLERDLARRLTMQQVYGNASTRDTTPRPRSTPAKAGVLGRFVRSIFQTAGVLSILLLVAGAATIPFVGTWLEHQDYPERADYIVPLPGDSHRLLKAAELYRQGFSPRILLSGGRLDTDERLQKLRSEIGYPDVDPSELQLRVLEHAGVPRASTALIAPSEPTIIDTAEALKRHVEGRRTKVIVVTSGMQSLRTKLIFEDAIPRARIIVVAPSKGGVERPWWNDQESILRTAAEAARLTTYWVGGGLRAPPAGTVASSQTNSANRPTESLGAGSDARRQ